MSAIIEEVAGKRSKQQKNTNTVMNTPVVKNINTLATSAKVNVTVEAAESRTTKLTALERVINQKRRSYNVVGLVDRTTDVVLQPTYHNVRNAQGQFAATRTYRRSAKGTFAAK